MRKKVIVNLRLKKVNMYLKKNLLNKKLSKNKNLGHLKGKIEFLNT